MYVSNYIRSKLNRHKNNIKLYKNWTKAVKLQYTYEYVPSMDPIKKISRAFYKLYELCTTNNLIHNTKNVCCLCDAPGGFSEAILYMIKNVNLYTQSINNGTIQFSTKIDPKYIDYSGDGDITKFGNILNIIKKAKQLDKFDLITADGGIDVSNNYELQEQNNTKLIFCQMYTALYSLKINGNFIIKVYDCFTLDMIKIIWILEQHFNDVLIIKPKLSRPCNSEKYIVCKNYKGIQYNNLHNYITNNLPTVTNNLSTVTNNLPTNNLPEIIIPQSFIDKMISINNSFAKKQIEALQETVKICTYTFSSYWENSRKLNQITQSKEFLKKLKTHNHLNCS